MQNSEYPILEFDSEKKAVFAPPYPSIKIPEHCVLPIYHEVIDNLKAGGLLNRVTDLKWEIGPLPVYVMDHHGTSIAVCNPGVGAPFAAAVMEELISLGCRKFVAYGSAGCLLKSIKEETIIIPISAVRDEGTSYHYAPPSREIVADMEVVRAIESVLIEQGTDYTLGKTWTTDGLYRETKDRVADRRTEGCLAVEMECAALIAVASFREVQFGQILAIADDVSGEGEGWKVENAYTRIELQNRLFRLAVEACLKL